MGEWVGCDELDEAVFFYKGGAFFGRFSRYAFVTIVTSYVGSGNGPRSAFCLCPSYACHE